MHDKYEAKVQLRVEQYKWAAGIVKEMIAELGEEKALDIAWRALTKIQENFARDLARKNGDTFEGFKRWLRKSAETNENIEILDEGSDTIETRVTHCATWDALSRLGLPQLCRTFCSTDSAMSQAFSPKLHYHVARQISAGDDSCDAGWTWKE